MAGHADADPAEDFVLDIPNQGRDARDVAVDLQALAVKMFTGRCNPKLTGAALDQILVELFFQPA